MSDVTQHAAEDPSWLIAGLDAAYERGRAEERERWIAKIEAIHFRIDEQGTAYCDEDGHIWPCRTIRAISPAVVRGDRHQEREAK
jgi:hypothetical protein